MLNLFLFQVSDFGLEHAKTLLSATLLSSKAKHLNKNCAVIYSLERSWGTFLLSLRDKKGGSKEVQEEDADGCEDAESS